MQTKGKDTAANENPGTDTGHSNKAKEVSGLQDSL